MKSCTWEVFIKWLRKTLQKILCDWLTIFFWISQEPVSDVELLKRSFSSMSKILYSYNFIVFWSSAFLDNLLVLIHLMKFLDFRQVGCWNHETCNATARWQGHKSLPLISTFSRTVHIIKQKKCNVKITHTHTYTHTHTFTHTHIQKHRHTQQNYIQNNNIILDFSEFIRKVHVKRYMLVFTWFGDLFIAPIDLLEFEI